MKQLGIIIGITAVAALVAVTLVASPREARAAEDFYTRLSIDEPVIHGNLAVYPVSLAGGGEKLGELMTLEEAMATGKFSIKEIEEGAQVNSLQAKNDTGKNVVLFAGEMVRGAKQDRIISYDTVVPPHGKVYLDAFCVEAGRWTEVSDRFEYKNEMAPASVRATAQGKNDQGEVWAAVSKVNEARGVASESDALTASYNDPAYQAKVKEYEAAFKDLARGKDVVGVVVVTEGKITAGDIFGSHDLFAKVWPRLLSSYAMDGALSSGLGGVISPATIKMRLAELDKAAREETFKGDNQGRKKAKAANAEAYEFEYDGATVHANVY
jgi:hypothetical protein